MATSELKYFRESREKAVGDCLPEYNKQGLLESARKLAEVAAAPEFITNEQ